MRDRFAASLLRLLVCTCAFAPTCPRLPAPRGVVLSRATHANCDLTFFCVRRPPRLFTRAGHHSYGDTRGLLGLLKICGGSMPVAEAADEPEGEVAALQQRVSALEADLAVRDAENAALKVEVAALKAGGAGPAARGEWGIAQNRLYQQ